MANIDEEERSCILTTILALRNVGGLSSHYSRHHADCGNDTTNDAPTDNNNDDNKKEVAVLMSSSDYISNIFLPDAVVQHRILSYRPFFSFRVLLIRGGGNDGEGGDNSNEHHRHRLTTTTESSSIIHSTRRDNNNCYTLIFRSNRGNIRFRVTELPYLPPCQRRRRRSSRSSSSSSDGEEQDNNINDDNIYQNADGIIISCYITRFFEYCDRYGYVYASSSIINDVTTRVEASYNEGVGAGGAGAGGAESGVDEDEDVDEIEREQSKKSNIPTVVLCGNDIDVTHVDAKVSSVVFNKWNNNNCKNNNDATAINTDTEGLPFSSTNGVMNSNPSFIDIPRHPFASLARNITNDNGLDFIVVNDDNDNDNDNDNDQKEDTTIIVDDDDDNNNYDLVMNDTTSTMEMEDVEMMEEDTTNLTTTTTTTTTLSKQPPSNYSLIDNNNNMIRNNNDNNNNKQQHHDWDWLRSRIDS